ncbi:pimeloyl-CoA dehydrogenase small subunit [Pararhodobacter marinus]|uniref:Pimeloyl-CoA dehydrogenase small subunit n=1 Tax=Pararhodobacter marinus TaxID=2184063 RepID=A0A2U2C462_9RHOB|nr:acyl-CoA dehydrogenase [Pararhodobacter marinus]PWE26594.1 pimeloyl-CoA dehydrogenase small subunit [Pararhodobacter marinus]
MDFNHTEERRMLADSLRRSLERGADWAALAELGVLGALFTEDEGGFGGHGFDIAVVFEELGRAGSAEPVLEAGLAGGLLADAGRADLVEEIIGGGLKVTLAHFEPGLRYDSGPITTSANEGHLSGRKSFVTQAEGSDRLLVSALKDGEVELFLVDTAAEGVTLHTTPALMGGTISEVTLDRVAGEAVGNAHTLQQRLAAATLAVCADALGAMDVARDMTLDYLRTRKQFGVPIGKFQALQHRMADVAIEIEMARSAVINAAGHLDAAGPTRDRHISAAKNLIGRTARLVAEEAVQMHGGIAMTEEYALAPVTRRLIAADHRFGDEDWHLARFMRLEA